MRALSAEKLMSKKNLVPEEAVTIVDGQNYFVLKNGTEVVLPIYTLRLEKSNIDIPEISIFALNKDELLRFVTLFKAKLNEFSYYKPDHSILRQIEGAKSDRQKSCRNEWLKYGVFMDFKFNSEQVINYIEKVLTAA